MKISRFMRVMAGEEHRYSAFFHRASIMALVIYLFSMFLYPLLSSGFSWRHLHDVLGYWQPLNVGILAFVASIIALNISRYVEEKRVSNEFRAARSLLPITLSVLSDYLRESSTVLTKCLDYDRSVEQVDPPVLPFLPEGLHHVFDKLISRSSDDIGKYLSRYLIKLQIHNSRLKSVHDFMSGGSNILPRNIRLSYLYGLCEIQAMTGKLFSYARSQESLGDDQPTVEEMHNASGNLGLVVDEISGFSSLIEERAASRHFFKDAFFSEGD